MAEPYGTEIFNAELAYIGEDLRAILFSATMAMEALNMDPHPGTMNVAQAKLLSLAHALVPTGRYKPELIKGVTDRLHRVKMGGARMNRLPGTWMAKEEWDPAIFTELNDVFFLLQSLIAKENLYRRPAMEPVSARKRI